MQYYMKGSSKKQDQPTKKGAQIGNYYLNNKLDPAMPEKNSAPSFLLTDYTTPTCLWETFPSKTCCLNAVYKK